MRRELNESFYESLYRDPLEGRSFEILSKTLAYRRIAKRLKLLWSRPRVLDVGFGSGDLLRETRRIFPGASCSGIEIAAAAVDAVLRQHPDWYLTVGSAERLPFPDQSFDLVVCSHTLEHLADDVPARRELQRVTAKGGAIIVAVPGPGSGDNKLHYRLYDEKMVNRLFPDRAPQRVMTYGSALFLFVFWTLRLLARRLRIVQTAELQSSKGTGSLASRLGFRFGVPALLAFYLSDSVLVTKKRMPFELWALWQI